MSEKKQRKELINSISRVTHINKQILQYADTHQLEVMDKHKDIVKRDTFTINYWNNLTLKGTGVTDRYVRNAYFGLPMGVLSAGAGIALTVCAVLSSSFLIGGLGFLAGGGLFLGASIPRVIEESKDNKQRKEEFEDYCNSTFRDYVGELTRLLEKYGDSPEMRNLRDVDVNLIYTIGKLKGDFAGQEQIEQSENPQTSQKGLDDVEQPETQNSDNDLDDDMQDDMFDDIGDGIYVDGDNVVIGGKNGITVRGSGNRIKSSRVVSMGQATSISQTTENGKTVVKVNGKKVYEGTSGENISVVGNRVYVDGKRVDSKDNNKGRKK